MDRSWIVQEYENLNTATPFVHQAVKSDLKELVVSVVEMCDQKWVLYVNCEELRHWKPPERSVSHHNPVVELVKRPFPFRSPVVVEQLDQTPVPLVESKVKKNYLSPSIFLSTPNLILLLL